jgi:outer membrane protein
MKNGLLVWNVLLTIGIGVLLVMQFSGKTKTATTDKPVAGDTTIANKDFRIAYFDMDSVEVNYEKVKEVKKKIADKENNINAELERMSNNFKKEYMRLGNEVQTGKTTQAAAEQQLKTMDDQLKNRKAVLDQEYQELVMTTTKEMRNTIGEYLKEYNKGKGYSYIIVNEPGLFYYRDTVYNITAEVVKGLNEYGKKKSN